MSIDDINPKSEKNKNEKEFKIFKSEEAIEPNENLGEDEQIPMKKKNPNSSNKKTKNKSNPILSIFNLKNLLISIGVIVLLYFSVRIIFKPSLSQYPKLDSCFITSVFKINLCPSNPKYVKANQVSKILIHSILISEDDSFYIHQGIDWNEFQKSFLQNWRSGKFVRGGSTVTQQLVKNIYLTPEKSLLRKFKEILLAQQVEEKYSKSIILEKYLNIIEFGYQIYGVKAASNYYFNKPPSQLNILESLYLTMLMPNPKNYSSSFKNGRLTPFQRDRIQTLLKRLLRRKRISLELYNQAKSNINLFPWKNLDLNESQKIEDNDLDFINDKSIYLDTYKNSLDSDSNSTLFNKNFNNNESKSNKNDYEKRDSSKKSDFLDVQEIKEELKENNNQEQTPTSEEIKDTPQTDSNSEEKNTENTTDTPPAKTPTEENVETYYEKE